jgi:hypothetical protein
MGFIDKWNDVTFQFWKIKIEVYYVAKQITLKINKGQNQI